MEVSALDRAATGKPSPNGPPAGAGPDLFGQMLDSLAPVDEPYAQDSNPIEDDEASEETAENETPNTAPLVDKETAELAFLGQQQQVESASKGSDADPLTPIIEIASAETEVAPQSITPSVTDTSAPARVDTTETAAIAAQAPETAAAAVPAAQVAGSAAQRATTTTQKPQAQQNAAIDPSQSLANQPSLRAGRDEALAQGNGQTDNPMADKGLSKSAAAGDEQPAQPAKTPDRPSVSEPQQQHAARPEAPAPTPPKVAPPPPPVATPIQIAASTPTATVPLDQTSGQPTASARVGDVQSATAAARTGAKPAATPQRSQPAEQIAVHIRNGLKAGADSIHVRLQPAELGRVEVRMQIDGDKHVQAVITVEKSETLDFLERDSRVLQRALEDAGLKTDRDSFTFQHQSSSDPGARSQNERQLAGGSNGDNTEAAENADGTTIANSRSSHDGLVDIEV